MCVDSRTDVTGRCLLCGSVRHSSWFSLPNQEPLGLCMDPIGCHFAWCPWVCRHAWPEAATDLALNCAGVVPGDPDQETVTQSISSCGDGLPAPREVPGWAAAARLVVPGLLSRSQQCVSRRLNEVMFGGRRPLWLAGCDAGQPSLALVCCVWCSRCIAPVFT